MKKANLIEPANISIFNNSEVNKVKTIAEYYGKVQKIEYIDNKDNIIHYTLRNISQRTNNAIII